MTHIQKLPVSALILTKNEAEFLPGCLACLQWCQEIRVLDTGSSDSTLEIAQRVGAQVETTTEKIICQTENTTSSISHPTLDCLH